MDRNRIMIKKYSVILFLVLNVLTVYSQNKQIARSLLSDGVEQQANLMGQAFIKGDYQLCWSGFRPRTVSGTGPCVAVCQELRREPLRESLRDGEKRG